MFKDRKDAGKKLAGELLEYKGANAVIFALPRGGVILGLEVAAALDLPLDIIAVRKIGHPSSSEYAIGVVDEHGNTIMNEREAQSLDPVWLQTETERQKREADRRVKMYRGGRAAISARNKIVIIVDDGIATGFSMQLAVRGTMMQKPSKIVVAVPVAPPESIRTVKSEGADDVILLESPQEFLGAVGAHYAVFDQVEDEEVVSVLNEAARQKGAK